MLKIGEIVHTLKGIIENRIDLVKLNIQQKFTEILSRVVLLVMMGISLLLVLIFLSLSLAFYLTQYFESLYIGFLLVGVFYLLIFSVLYIIRDRDSTQNRMQKGLKGFIFRTKIFN